MRNVRAVVVTIGNELLSGRTTDTNSQFICKELYKIGASVRKIVTIQDTHDAIVAAITDLKDEFNLIICTGGLGPTKDDITKNAMCEVTGRTLIENNEVRDAVQQFFENRGRVPNQLNHEQALVPSDSKIFVNKLGTAPGLWIDHGDFVLVAMPGVPHEMKHLMVDHIIPTISAEFEVDKLVVKTLSTTAIGESNIAEKIEDIEADMPEELSLAYLPSPGIVHLRLSVPQESKNLLNLYAAKILERVGEYTYSDEEMDPAKAMGIMLRNRKETVSTAESCTGGYIAHQITAHAGSSDYFEGSVVSYSNDVKMGELGVSEATLKEYGAVSEGVVIQMAEGVRNKLKTTYGVSCSGIAGPDGGSEEKPVGTVWIACAGPFGTVTKKLTLGSRRLINIELTSVYVFDLLRRYILANTQN